jgi:DNA adenine methylase|tara:strand:+ start:542 stop:1429 length:888 start_codon:yes stop_codon:yes gene_type:complete
MNYKDLKTPLRYPGGKSRAVKFLFEEGDNMPGELNVIKEYREPFLGGGSCAFAFSSKNPDIPVWVNDKYYNLYCFWTVLQKEGDRLAEKLHSVKTALTDSEDPLQAHLDYYKVMREGLSTATDPFEIAWMFYVMNRCSFSGLGESTGSFSKDAVKDLFNHRLISKLPKFSQLMKNWKITNLDYTELFDDEPYTFVFADPPYDINSFIYGNNGDMHDTFDHKEFHDCVDASKNMIMITYNSNEDLQKAYHNWTQKEWDLTYTMHSGKKYREDEHNRKELLLLNYQSETPSSLENFF